MINSQFIPVNIPSLGELESEYVNDCLQTGWISSEGPYVAKLENAFSKYIGREYGIAVSNGSGALDIAIQALGIGEGDEVIMPTFTIISPALSVVRAGAIPVLVDSDRKTWTMNVAEIEAKITPKTKAILAVHIYGLPVDMEAVMRLAGKHNLLVLEDAAEVIGQHCGDRLCGSFGDISIFSFYANKHITTGEGGMIVTDRQDLADRCAKLRNLAFEKNGPRFIHHEMGWNYRITNLQAAIGLAQLQNIASALEKKHEMGRFYSERLGFLTEKGFQLPVPDLNYATNIYWVFGIMAPDADSFAALTSHLTKNQIGWRPFFWCMHEQPVFLKKNLFGQESYPQAEQMARLGFYLPSGLGHSSQEQETVCAVIQDFFS